MICCDACQNTIMLTLKEDNTSHEASRCELTTHITQWWRAGPFVAFFLNTFLNSLLLFVHIFTNSAVFQLPEGKMLSYFGFVSILLPSYFCVYYYYNPCESAISLLTHIILSLFPKVTKGSAFDIPNGILGMLFYTYVLLRCNIMKSSSLFLLDRRINAVICSLALASSIFLARKLYMIKEICIVCLSTHVINTTIFLRAMREVLKNKDKVS